MTAQHASRQHAGAANTELLMLDNVESVRPVADGFPQLVQSPSADVSLAEWFAQRGDEIRAAISQVGAILFRGFLVASPKHFEQAVGALSGELNADYGDLPRTVEDCRFVQQATPYPPDRAILFHNEASHTSRWPNYQWLYCKTPAEAGGETPLVRCDNVWRQLPADLRATFEQRRLCYSRRFIPGLDRRWQQFFGTGDPRKVEARCLAAGVAWNWQADGLLRISTPRPAVLRHAYLQTTTFFNQVLLHHPFCLDLATRESLLELYGLEGLPRNVTFGDGSQIPDEVIGELLELTVKSAVCFAWEPGDVLMLDNTAVAHARRPFRGERCLVVALSRFISDDEYLGGAA